MYNTMNCMEEFVSYTIDKNKCLNSPNSFVKSTTSTTTKNTYEIYNYVCNEDEEDEDRDVSMYKSVIIDKYTRDIYGFSPPKSVGIATFVSKYLYSEDDLTSPDAPHPQKSVVEGLCPSDQTMRTDTYLINDIIEGIMVNLWYDFFAETWEISTRYSVGGMEKLFGQGALMPPHSDRRSPNTTNLVGDRRSPDKFGQVDEELSILEMFLEAIGGTGTLHERMEKICEQYRWQKSYSYHFVLQHPHMTVYPPNSLESHHPIAGFLHEPHLYLVSVYYIVPGIEETEDPDADVRGTVASRDDVPNVYFIPQTRFQHWEELQIPWLKFPRYVTADVEYNSLVQFYSSVQSDIQMTGAGVMITNTKTGTRTKLVSAIYQEYRELRSNNMPLLFQYLCLKYVNRLDHFLQYFTIYYPVFLRFEHQYLSLLHHLYNAYLNKYVYRNCFRTPRFESIVDSIHQHVYLKNKNVQKKFKITLQIVKSYVDSMTPMNLMYLLDARSIVTV